MESNCTNCKFFEQWRRARYPKGWCTRQYAFRISDGYKSHLTISTPTEYICDTYEPAPQPIYALDQNDNPILIPPIMADDLRKQGWVLVKLDGSGNIIKKDERNSKENQ